MINPAHPRHIVFLAVYVLFSITPSWAVSASTQESKGNTSSDSIEKISELNTYVEPGLTILGFVMAFGLLMLQLKKQHASNLNLQREQFKAKIQQEIFNEISDGIYRSTNAHIKMQGKLLAVRTNFDRKLFLEDSGIFTEPLTERIDDFVKCHFDFSSSIIELVYILEKYVITDRVFEIFNMALQSASYDLDKVYQKVNDSLLMFLPVDLAEDEQKKLGVKILEPKKKSKDDIVALKNSIADYNDYVLDIASYLYDLKTEAQNILLGEIFNNKVHPRRPNDGEYVVVGKSTGRTLDEQEHYFMHETEWGKNWQSALKKVSN